MGGIRFTWVSQDGVWMEMGKMEQRKRGRAKYHNFQGCRRGQFLMMVFILSKPSSSFFFSHYVMKWGKKKIFTFSALFRPSIIFCSRYGYGKSKSDIGNDCFLLLVWHNNGCNGLLLLPQNSSSGERELAQCLLCPAVSWYLEAGNDDIHRSYTRWPCIVSNVVIYILPWLRSNLAWYPSV